MAEDQKRTAAYVPWATFKNAVEQLAKGIPHKIDRSVFPGIAWNAQTQLFIALRFFGLLKGEDEPTPLLADLVAGTEEERKEKLEKVVRAAYADLIAIDLTKASRSHFEEHLASLYNVNGDTKIKAVRFFLSAAECVGIPLSPFILPGKGKGGGARRAKTVGRPKTPKSPVATHVATDIREDLKSPTGTAKTVGLTSGGTLTISATKDFFSLNAKDRKFFNELVDKLEAYESETP